MLEVFKRIYMKPFNFLIDSLCRKKIFIFEHINANFLWRVDLKM